MEKIYLSVSEAALFLQKMGYPVTKRTIYQHTSEGAIPFYRFGKLKMLFKPDELKKWAENELVCEGSNKVKTAL
ncbi:MAG: helix-turn-helix domain-containing protein [Tissierellia bacterium]|jgi:excisionase family DNA binding protein|nr:helix-turn-helix domain-containing protein [Tissierellia bacterium]